MPARILIRPPARPSNGAQSLRSALGDAARLSRKQPVPRQYRTVINWGNSTPLQCNQRVINKPEAISNAVNKLTCLQLLQDKGVRVPAFATSKTGVADGMYLARTVLGGSGGQGIVVVRKGEPFPAAPLYTQYVKKEEEMRVHVANGRVIFMQLKLRQRDTEQTADQKLIRNHDNGWVFAPRDCEGMSEDTKQQAINAVAALGLDFAAVDIIIGKADRKAYVLELNTSPGIESPGLLLAYKNAFTEMCNGLT